MAMTGNRIEFQVDEHGGIVVQTFGGSDCRAECATEILSDLVSNAPEHFLGRRGGVWFCDSPPDLDWVARYDLAFCSTKRMLEPSPCLPFPCPMFLRWPQVGIPNAEELMNNLLAVDSSWEDERMFWIGANTHPVRMALASLSSHYPDLFDAEIMEWDRKAEGGQRSKTRQVSLPDHRRYKYLIDCAGYGYSARIKWLLAMGRPLFIVERDVVEHWHEEMQPWVHFIPVATDLSDLFEHRSILEADPELYRAICRQAREFVEERLTVEARLRSVLEAMDRQSYINSNIKAASSGPSALPNSEFFRDLNSEQIWNYAKIFREFLASKEDRIWLRDRNVWNGGDWCEFLDSFAGCDADFLACVVRRRSDEPEWTWWKSLRPPGEGCPLEFGVAALLSLVRLSRAACEAVLKGIDEGWAGHPEALIPTLVHLAGLKIEDIGGTGNFTPPERKGCWYDKRTWHWQGPVEFVPGLLHFPVTRQTRALAKGRIPSNGSGKKGGEWKMLYVSPVGMAAKELLPGVMEAFLKARTDCRLLQYDESELAVPDGVRVIRDKGFKWQLALKHLYPEAVADYDYIFFWDDDLKVGDFDPIRFARIMQVNRLEMAQPAIQSPHGLSHAITKHRPCPPPWRDPDGVTAHPVVGRLTNFVEIMAPVFTREAWREFYSYLDPDNRSGWGYDYIPLGRKGIVDAMPVIHTRAVQSINGESKAEIRRFLDDQGLFRHTPVEQGWLFER